ncbi:CDK5 regulatory subunit-associated protein 3 [Schistocerca cancellata]|uniref:CDK5 regulatory subunit-associated protein 3 n=1 Tax=Schistocerca cancellata TaxID=274614 RepID=UPI0021180029|nr:CDK5 regulatory subunit-associated protein 3 [Schistocerca cancellata]
MDQNIPIDIHTNKLLDWMVSRRHVNRDWQNHVLTVRERINNAIQDMPVHDGIAKLLSGSYINYFHCKKIVEILKETEADSRNFFGSYGSKRMKDWQEVLRLYEKDNVYLADAAQMLIRNVTYEVPGLKKQIAKCGELQEECDKKEAEYIKAEGSVRSELAAQCRQLGISAPEAKSGSGDAKTWKATLRSELVERLSELPRANAQLAAKAAALKEAVTFYNEFVSFVAPGCSERLQLLKHIIDHGDTTTYEWTYGEPPVQVEEPVLDFGLEDDTGKSGAGDTEIDFGTDGGIDFGDLENGNTDAIDFGEAAVDETGGIDWGNIDTAETVDNSEEIDFNISLEESGIVVEATGLEGGVARGNEALTVLDNPRLRNQFIDEVMELQAFLKIRLFEMRDDSVRGVQLTQLQNVPMSVQLQSSETVEKMLGQVAEVLSTANDPKIRHLCNIKHSYRYVDRLVEQLQHKLRLAEKMVAQQAAARQKKAEAAEEARALQPKLKLIVEKTKELQKEIQQDISKRYNNRRVNIMGGVNLL